MKSKIKNLIIICSLFFLIILITSCQDAYLFTTLNYDFYLDTSSYITIEYNANKTNKDKIKKDVYNDIENILIKMENTFSPSKMESSLYQLNQNKTIENDLIASLIKQTNEYSNKYPLFDLSIGSLTSLWNISKQAEYCYLNNNCKIPTDEEIKNVLPSINYTNIKIDNNKINLNEDMKLDFGAIIKGYTTDLIKEYLINKGYYFFVINLGGNVYINGESKIYQNKGEAVDVLIENPFDNNKNLLQIYPHNQTIVTSGIDKRYIVDKMGQKYHHILNKNTGYPVDNEIEQVTIITDSSYKADIISTTVLLYGLSMGENIIKDEDVTGIIVTKNKEIYIINNNGIEFKPLNDYKIIGG